MNCVFARRCSCYCLGYVVGMAVTIVIVCGVVVVLRVIGAIVVLGVVGLARVLVLLK